jgi:ketosteroid isomerase-like protein
LRTPAKVFVMTAQISTHTTEEALALEWPAALAAGDIERLRQVLAPTVRYRETSPENVTEHAGAEALLDALSRHFAHVRIEVTDAAAEAYRDRVDLSYTVRAETPQGPRAFRQHAWIDVVDGRITAIDALCSGVGAA